MIKETFTSGLDQEIWVPPIDLQPCVIPDICRSDFAIDSAITNEPVARWLAIL
jgi:hypothetical protein